MMEHEGTEHKSQWTDDCFENNLNNVCGSQLLECKGTKRNSCSQEKMFTAGLFNWLYVIQRDESKTNKYCCVSYCFLFHEVFSAVIWPASTQLRGQNGSNWLTRMDIKVFQRYRTGLLADVLQNLFVHSRGDVAHGLRLSVCCEEI